MIARLLKLKVTAVIIFEEDGKFHGETVTKEMDIFSGQEITDEFISKLEELALQNFESQRSQPYR
jgi:hypothetical protein